MKNKRVALITALFTAQIGFSQINTPSGIVNGNSGVSTNVGIGTISGVIPNAKLEILNSANKQLRISNTTTKFADVQTTALGDLILKPTSSGVMTKIGLGTYAPVTGFHSNLGLFRITDSSSTTRGIQISPNVPANGDLPGGSFIQQISPFSGDGLSLVPFAGGTAGVKLGAYAFCSSGWRSVWETSNTGNLGGLPNLLLVKNGGNVGIGTGLAAPTAKLEVAGQVKITGGTPGIGKVLTSDLNGLASWSTLTGVLSGGTTNYIPKWTSGNTLSNSLIYDNGGSLGIGTNNPTQLLQLGDRFVFHNGGVKYFGYNMSYNGTNNVRLANDYSSALVFSNGDINFDTDISDAAGSVVNATTKLSIKNNGNVGIGTTTPRAKLDVNGKVYIGTAAPATSGPHNDASLSVDGKILATSIYVSITAGVWADYVFDESYKLMPLNEVETFYEKNHHLPGIKSSAEIEKNGLSLEEMNIKLLEKIEELTLYLVELKKEIELLKNK